MNVSRLDRMLWCGLGLSILMLVGVGAMTWKSTTRLVELNKSRIASGMVVRALQALIIQIVDAETEQRGYLLTGNPRHLESFRATRAQVAEQLARVKQLLALQNDEEVVSARMLALIDARFDEMDETIRLPATSGPAPAHHVVATERGKALMDSLRASIHDIQSREEALLKVRDDRVRAGTAQAMTALLLGSAVTIGLILALFLVLRREVAQRSRAEADAQSHRAILESVIDSIGDGVVVSDREGRFTLFNPAAEKIVGRGQTDATKESWTEHYGVFLPDGVTPFPTEQLPLVRASRGESVDEDLQFLKNAGHPEGVWLSVNGRPLRDEHGELQGGVVVLRDVSHQRNVQESLVRLNVILKENSIRLESANRELEAFAYSVSHDLRAPLRSIDGFSQALLEDYQDRLDDTGLDFLRRVRHSSQRMAELIDDLLDLSRVSRAEMRTEEVDLSGLALSVADQLRQAEPDRDVKFEIVPGLTARGDTRLLKGALENLLGNSWKFTSRRAGARIVLECECNAEGTVFVLRDNGAGFDMAYAGKLFGAFQRLHDAREYAGTGIGLATVQRIIHRHGGRIWAEGRVGEGATFYFTLEAA